jgi:hypothetical protein
MKRRFVLEVWDDLMTAISITEVNKIKSANVVLFDSFPVLFRFARNAEQRIRRIENEKRMSWSNQLN